MHPDTGGAYFYRKGTIQLRAELPIEIHHILLKKPNRGLLPKTDLPSKPTSGRLRAICKRVAEAPQGNRQTIAFQWAAQILKADHFPATAWDLVADAIRDAGGTERDVETALREHPAGTTRIPERVHA